MPRGSNGRWRVRIRARGSATASCRNHKWAKWARRGSGCSRSKLSKTCTSLRTTCSPMSKNFGKIYHDWNIIRVCRRYSTVWTTFHPFRQSCLKLMRGTIIQANLTHIRSRVRFKHRSWRVACHSTTIIRLRNSPRVPESPLHRCSKTIWRSWRIR